MTDRWALPCTVCENPIQRQDLSEEPCWHHVDVETCRENIRADERERHGNNCRGLWDEWVHDLRAQVAALEARHPWGPGGTTMVSRSDVLALFAQESDGEQTPSQCAAIHWPHGPNCKETP